VPKTQDEMEKDEMRRVEANDPVALRVREVGKKRYKEGDYGDAFKYFTHATELGDVDAQYNLSVLYYKGEGVEKNAEKEVYHLEEAAIGGHHLARHNLAIVEKENGRTDRAIKHFIIAAKLG